MCSGTEMPPAHAQKKKPHCRAPCHCMQAEAAACRNRVCMYMSLNSLKSYKSILTSKRGSMPILAHGSPHCWRNLCILSSNQYSPIFVALHAASGGILSGSSCCTCKYRHLPLSTDILVGILCEDDSNLGVSFCMAKDSFGGRKAQCTVWGDTTLQIL